MNAYQTIKEARKNDAAVARQIELFLEVKGKVLEILQDVDAVTAKDEIERILVRNLIEGMAKDGEYLNEVNGWVAKGYEGWEDVSINRIPQ